MAQIQTTTTFDYKDPKTLKSLRDEYILRKTNFTNQFKVLSKYFYQRGVDVKRQGSTIQQGQFLNDGSINDSAGSRAAKQCASAISGAMFKNGAKTFRLKSSRHIENNDEVKEYFERINADYTSYMENPASKFEISYNTAMDEFVVYGTKGLSSFKGDYSTPLKYTTQSVLNMYLDYDETGEIDTIMIDQVRSARKLFMKYGVKAGKRVVAAINNKKYGESFVVSTLITPRKVTKASAGKLAMPFGAYIFMPDEDIFLEEDGFESLPTSIGFCYKLDHEDYGRGFGGDALPTMKQMNELVEILVIGSEQSAAPAMGAYDAGSLAGQVIDFTSHAVNVFDVMGTIPSNPPIFPLYTVGDLRMALELLKMLYEQLASHFLIDRFYDLGNGGQRMTLGEADIRNAIRGDATASIYAQESAFFTKVINRDLDILFSMGLLGVENLETDDKAKMLIANGLTPFVIPDSVLKAMKSGLDWYEVEFTSPAAMTMKSSELASTNAFFSLLAGAAGLSLDFLDAIDPDGTVANWKELTGVNQIVLKSKEKTLADRRARYDAEAENRKIQLEAISAKANQSNSQAVASQVGAMRAMTGGMGAGQ
jgi:hypothetical protein